MIDANISSSLYRFEKVHRVYLEQRGVTRVVFTFESGMFVVYRPVYGRIALFLGGGVGVQESKLTGAVFFNSVHNVYGSDLSAAILPVGAWRDEMATATVFKTENGASLTIGIYAGDQLEEWNDSPEHEIITPFERRLREECRREVHGADEVLKDYLITIGRQPGWLNCS